MKQRMMDMFKQIGAQVQEMKANPDTYATHIQNDPGTKYREDFFQAIKKLELSENFAAELAMEVALDVNQYDAEISATFINEMMIPVFELALQEKDKLPVQKHLSDEQVLKITAKGCSLQYKM